MTVPARVICDAGEGRSGLPGLLSRQGVEVQTARLSVGDYLLSASFAVERKTPRDLVDSLLSGRLMVQLDALGKAFEFAALLIEGDAWAGDRRLRSPMLTRLYHWISLRPYLSVLYSPDAAFSARILAGLAVAEQSGRAAGPVRPAYTPPSPKSPEDVLRALPGVGTAGAQKLLRRFVTLRGVLCATEAELVETIGPTRGRKLARLLAS